MRGGRPFDEYGILRYFHGGRSRRAARAGVCAGFFTIHAAAVGWLNRNLVSSRGRANSLYVLFYYAGGACGITLNGIVYERFSWVGVVGMGATMLLIPLWIGLQGLKHEQT